MLTLGKLRETYRARLAPDHLTLLHVYQLWKASKPSRCFPKRCVCVWLMEVWGAGGYSMEWCNKHFLQHKVLKKAREIREQLVEIW